MSNTKKSRVGLGLVILGVVLLVLIALSFGSLFYLLKSSDGQRNLFDFAKQYSNGRVEIIEPKGNLLEAFSAKEVRLALPKARLLLRDVQYEVLSYNLRPAALHLKRFQVGELNVVTQPGPTTPPPTNLALPLNLIVDEVSIAQLNIEAGGTNYKVSDIQGSISANDRIHNVSLKKATFNQMVFDGQAELGATSPLPLNANINIRASDWLAQLTGIGPLERFALSGKMQVATAKAENAHSESRAAPIFILAAQVKPFESMPIAQAKASFSQLNVNTLIPQGPTTSLSGTVDIALAAASPMRFLISATNANPGSLDKGLLPISAVTVNASGTPDNATIELFQIQFARQTASKLKDVGSVKGVGTWSNGPWQMTFDSDSVLLNELNTTWPALKLIGKISATGSDTQALKPITVSANVKGLALVGTALPAGLSKGGDLILQATVQQNQITVSAFNAQWGMAKLNGKLQATRGAKAAQMDKTWRIETQLQFSELDPFLLMPKSNARVQSATLNGATAAKATITLGAKTLLTRAQADFDISNSLWGKQSLSAKGAVTLLEPPNLLAKEFDQLPRIESSGRMNLGRNSGQWSGRIGAANDVMQWSVEAPELASVQLKKVTGNLSSAGTLSGSWSALKVDANVEAQELGFEDSRVKSLKAKVQVALQPDAPFVIDAVAEGIRFQNNLGSMVIKGNGSLKSHRLDASGTMQRDNRKIVFAAQLNGETDISSSAQSVQSWTGRVEKLRMDDASDSALSPVKPDSVLVNIDPFTLRWQKAEPYPVITVSASKATVVGVPVQWNNITWQGALRADGKLGPFMVEPLQRRLLGGEPLNNKTVVGDLTLSGQFAIDTTGENTRLNFSLQRDSGDLRLGGRDASFALGLRAFNINLVADQGQWRTQQFIEGQRIGKVEANVLIKTSARDFFPASDALLTGTLSAKLEDLSVWNGLLPPGWRANGGLTGQAQLAGSIAKPSAQGALVLINWGLKNPIEGVDVRDGGGQITFNGEQFRLEKVSAKGGEGTLLIDGSGMIAAKPSLQLNFKAENFRVLGRVDRHIETTGTARLEASPESIKLVGSFKIDRGLLDITREEAPSLSDDVVVTRSSANLTPIETSRSRKTAIDLDVGLDMGPAFSLKGRGLNTRLAGSLKFTTPGGQLAANGTVRASRGTYRAYGQDLEISRGQIVFSGNTSNPRLNILALRARADVDQSVGVAITGTALSPRIKLFSDPERPDNEKLALLILGKSSDNLSRDDTAFLQKAALALLSGGGESISSNIGLDTLGIGSTDGTGATARDTVITIGKQVSEKLYVGYERALKATTGTLQLIYQVNNKISVRMQSGEESSIDLFWRVLP